jgi:SnoaL-like domain
MSKGTPHKTGSGDDQVSELQIRLARIEAIEAIRRAVARYARGADLKNDPVVMGSLFSDQAVWEANGFGRFEGRSEIVAALSRVAQQRILWCVHYMVDPLIELGPTAQTARCTWYLWELAKMPDETGKPQDSWIAGYYDAALSLTPSGWLFDQVKLDIRLIGPTTLPWEPTGIARR